MTDDENRDGRNSRDETGCVRESRGAHSIRGENRAGNDNARQYRDPALRLVR